MTLNEVYKSLFIFYLFYGSIVLGKKFDYHKLSSCYKPAENKFAKYVASLRLREEREISYGSKHFCSGAIISTKYILTAGHCLQNLLKDNKQNDTLHHVEAIIGNQHRLVRTKQTKIIRIENFLIHPNYTNDNNNNDLAILQLAQAVPLEKDYREILSLPNHQAQENMSCILVNWHEVYKNGPLSDELHHNEVLLSNFESCNHFYDDVNYQAQYLIICGKNLLDESCNHDHLGALLICNNQLIGVSRPSIKPCNPAVGIPFTNVFHYIEWLNQIPDLNDSVKYLHNIFIICIKLSIVFAM